MTKEYYKTDKSVEEYIKAAEGFDGAEHIGQLKTYLPSGSTLLEIGTGPGSDWEILHTDYDVTGSDFSKQFLERLDEKFPSGEFLELDAATLLTQQKFDGIYSNKVLHHLNDEEMQSSIYRQHDILNPDGVICHSFWEGQGSEIFKGMFVKYHTMDSLKGLFETRFEILLMEYYNEFEDDDSILLIARKK